MVAAPVETTAMTNPSGHQPVMLREVLELLAPRAGGRYLDATFGGGGHTGALLAIPGTSVVALDRDPAAAARAAALREMHGDRFRLIDLDFGRLAELGDTGFDGILFDLGVSSFQLDDPARGFSFQADGPLDMRMDTTRGETALSLLQRSSPDVVARWLRELAEEPFAGPIARAACAWARPAPSNSARA